MKMTALAVLQNGKYVLNSVLGEGKVGITYLATQTYLNQKVAIKTFNQRLRQNSDFAWLQQQFVAYSVAIAACKHPGIVHILDLFEEAGLYYVVMEYVPGKSLAQLIKARQQLPETEVFEYIKQTAQAVSVVHQNSLLHRDIRPKNIIFRQDTNKIVLINFGMPGEFTDGYAAIEQYLTGEKLTPATDIYALSATFYCLLLGHPPLPAPTRVNKVHSQALNASLPELGQLQPAISPHIEQAICRGLEMASKHRPQTVEEWLTILKVRLPQPNINHLDVTNLKNNRTLTLPILPRTISNPEENKPSNSAWQLGTHQIDSDIAPAPRISVVETVLTSEVIEPRKPKPAKKAAPVQQRVLPMRTTQAPAISLNRQRSPLKMLMITSAIAASVGAGFGLAIRLHAISGPGSGLLHTEQSFPPRDQWPISDNP